MRVWSIVVADAVCWVSTSSASEVTVTVSLAPATDRAAANSATCPIVRRTELCISFAKPGASTVTEYSPGGSDSRMAVPAPFVCADFEIPFWGSAAVTVAPGTTAPLASFTITCNSEVWTCAAAPATRHAVAISKQQSLRKEVILISFCGSCCPNSGLRP